MSDWTATGANAGTGMPSSPISRFSSKRSCATSRLRWRGNTGTRSARKRTVATGTFSNSKVTTSTALGEGGERRLVLIGRDRARRGDRERRALRVGAIDVAGEAKLGGGERQHAAELSAAEDADDHARRDRPLVVSRHQWASLLGRLPTAADCFVRQRSSAVATFLSERARMAAARSAALIAPERPMASVPTGTPAGIWTME